jgi:hypothetical protein
MKYANETTRVYVLALVSLTIIGALSVITSKFYSADGGNYLFDLVISEELHSFQVGRTFAHYLLKLPAWIAIKLDVTNFRIISSLMGIPFFLQIILGLGCTRWFLSKEYKNLIIFPILSIFVFILNTEYAIESESITLASFFWPVFAFLYCNKQKIEYSKLIVFILFALILPYTYETFFVCSLPLIWYFYKKSNLSLKIIFIPYYVITSIHQFYNVIFHEYASNTKNFIYSVYPSFFGLTPWGKIEFLNVHLLGIFGLFGYLIYLLLTKTDRKVNYKALYVFCIITFLVVLFNPYLLSYISQFTTRTLNSISPLIFVFIIYLLDKNNLYDKITRYNKLIVLIVFTQTLVSFLTTYHWHKFSRSLNESLLQNKGIFKLDTKIVHPFEPKGLFLLPNFQIWSLPIYSIFLNDNKNIKSLAYYWDHHFMSDDLIKALRTQETLQKYGFELSYE